MKWVLTLLTTVIVIGGVTFGVYAWEDDHAEDMNETKQVQPSNSPATNEKEDKKNPVIHPDDDSHIYDHDDDDHDDDLDDLDDVDDDDHDDADDFDDDDERDDS